MATAAPPPPGADLAYQVLSDEVVRQVAAVEGVDTKLGVAGAALVAITAALYAAHPPTIVAALVSGWVFVALVQAYRGFRYDLGYADGVNAKFLEERINLAPLDIKRRSMPVLKAAQKANQDRLDRKGHLLNQVAFTLVLVAGVGLLGKMLGVA